MVEKNEQKKVITIPEINSFIRNRIVSFHEPINSARLMC